MNTNLGWKKKNRGLFPADMKDFPLLLDTLTHQILKDKVGGALFKDAGNC